MSQIPAVPSQPSLLGEVKQQDTVAVPRDEIRKVSNILQSGARLLRRLEQEGDAVTVAANVGRVARLRNKLSPVVDMARAAVAEAREAAGDAYIPLEALLALRGRVDLPHHDASEVTTAWQILVTALDMVSTGVESFERLVKQGEALLALPSVDDFTEQTANELTRDLRYAESFPDGVRRQLEMARKVMDRVHNGEAEVSAEQAEVGALSYVMAPPQAKQTDKESE